ncbi:MAG TPA: multicopper oxidase family protein [Gemmatimonadaceae bacterium]|nr:multicopper oxidase family protein [Gemmatimonadaceae bacterium]
MGRASVLRLLVVAFLTINTRVPRSWRHPPPPSPIEDESNELAAPPTLQNASRSPHVVEVSITAAPAQLAIVPGKTTSALAYNGRIPGPTLDVHEGDSVIVHFTNQLSEPTTVHWHGLHIPATQDGSPFEPVMPGERHDYVFRIAPGTAGTYWYHPHPDRRSGYQVAMGLFGGIIVRPARDPVPAPIQEKLLILSDNRFRPDGTIDFADSGSMAAIVDAENGREGDILFVNGQHTPSLSIRAGEVQRWRIVNASAARIYRLSVDGATLFRVGSDGGLFEHPEKVSEVVLANSDRVELLVRGDAAPGTRTALRALPYDRYDPHTRPTDWNRPLDLLSLTYSNAAPAAPVAIPSTLRPVAWLDTSRIAEHRVVVFTQGMINGKHMDMNRVDFTGRVGTTEIWEIENLVGMDHPFHLHGFRFQVLDRNGEPELVPRWEDTIDVPPHESVRIVVRFDDFAGKWMFHCHILDHEDMGMMGVLLLE